MSVNYRDSYGQDVEKNTVESQQQRIIYLLSEQNKLLRSISMGVAVIAAIVLAAAVIWVGANW